jgi:hypothetical protein
MTGTGARTHGVWRIIAVILFTLLLLLLLSGCDVGPAPQPPSDQSAAGEPVEPALMDDSTAIAIGSTAAGRLAGGLIGPLTAAVEAGGPAGAIDFCSREALTLTAVIQDSIGGVDLKRTTLRPRNPANAPDPLERAVLDDLHVRAARGEPLPDHVLQHVDGATRFYRPLRVQPLCVRCHGTADQLDPSVAAILRERYPNDLATGYRDGDLRGVIRVEIR